MSPRQPDKDQQVDQWVRESLQRREQAIDATELVAKVRARMERPVISASLPKSPGSRARRPSLTWRAVAAAAVLAGIICLLPLSTEHASAETLVQQALQEDARRPEDRCYVIETDWMAPPELEKLVRIPNKSLLWTRGERFVLELPISLLPNKAKDANQMVRCGRDESGRIWFALMPQFGYRFEPKESHNPKSMGEKIRETCELYGMNSKALLRDVLDNYNLKRESASVGGESESVHAIDAAPKASRPSLSIKNARMEFDHKNKMLRRVTLKRKSNTITFTLKEVSSAVKAESFYRLESYLNADGLRRLLDPNDGRNKMLIEPFKKDQ